MIKGRNVYPVLASKMAFNYHDAGFLANTLGITQQAVRRRLRGEVEFELPEIKKLLKLYNCQFEELFEIRITA